MSNSTTKSAWHKARNRKVVKKADEKGNVTKTVTMGPGPSLKEWARAQVKDQHLSASDCETWLNNKAGKLERLAKAERKANKGALNAQIAAATKAAKKSKKKS